MSDLGRKNISDKVSEAVKPDSEKSTLEKAKESATGQLDKLAADATPDNQKSFSQSVSDNVQQGHDDAKKAATDAKQSASQEQATLADTAAEYVDAAKEQIANAAQYVSGVVTGATEGAKDASDNLSKK